MHACTHARTHTHKHTQTHTQRERESQPGRQTYAHLRFTKNMKQDPQTM